jgi:hypothetical protein
MQRLGVRWNDSRGLMGGVTESSEGVSENERCSERSVCWGWSCDRLLLRTFDAVFVELENRDAGPITVSRRGFRRGGWRGDYARGAVSSCRH